MSATYEASASRDGVEVRVTVELLDDAKYPDQDELGEVVGAKAGGILARVHEVIAAAQLPF